MTPQERQLVEDLFSRLSKVESAPRDPDATAAITQGLRAAPNAIYPLVQTVLVQDEALRRASDRIQQLEDQLDKAPQQNQGGGGFLDSMRGAIFGQGQSGGSVPNVRPPDVGSSRPVWNSGQVLQQSGQHYDQGGYGQSQGGYGQGGQGGYGQSPMGGGMGGGMMGGGGGGSFLGTAAAAAVGVVGGSLLLNSIRGMMGGSGHHAFGDSALAGDRGAGSSPWSDNSNSSLARDAGLNDIGSKNLAQQDYAQDLAQDQEDDLRAQDERDDLEADANDDFGNDDSDFA
jgi:hypothetical protein